jgi:hypothetical protein
MIYRTGKYTPYKGMDQDIEMMLKFINNEDTQKACISFSKLEEDFEEERKQSDESPTKDTDTIPFNEDKIKVSQTLSADIELPSGQIYIEAKDVIDPAGGGNLVTGNVEEKRSKEELSEVLTDKSDLGFMYKIVSNSTILKFQVTLREGFNVEKDDVKFGFNLHIESKRSATQTLIMKVPVMINTGKLKINNTGGNINSG